MGFIIFMKYEDQCRCENCEGEVDDIEPLMLTVFNEGQDAGKAPEYQFCSWECVFEYLPGIPCDYFISLPFLHYDSNRRQDSADAFLKLIKKR